MNYIIFEVHPSLGLYIVVLLAAIPKPAVTYHKGQPSNLYWLILDKILYSVGWNQLKVGGSQSKAT